MFPFFSSLHTKTKIIDWKNNWLSQRRDAVVRSFILTVPFSRRINIDMCHLYGTACHTMMCLCAQRCRTRGIVRTWPRGIGAKKYAPPPPRDVNVATISRMLRIFRFHLYKRENLIEADFMDSRNFDKVFWAKTWKNYQRNDELNCRVCFNGIIILIRALIVPKWYFLFYHSRYNTVELRFRERGSEPVPF